MKVMPICDGKFHLENEITNLNCYVCNKISTTEAEMVLLRAGTKEFRFACLDHPGIVIEFLRQYKRIPLGWSLSKDEVKV